MFLRFIRFGSKGSIRSMRSKGWKYFPNSDIFYKKICAKKLRAFAPLRALRETKNVQKVGYFGLPMLVLSPIIKVRPLPYSLFLFPYLLFAIF